MLAAGRLLPFRRTKTCGSAIVVVLLFVLLISGIAAIMMLKGRSVLRTTDLEAWGVKADLLAPMALSRIKSELSLEARAAQAQSIILPLPVRFGESDPDPRKSRLIRRSVGDDTMIAAAYSSAGLSNPPFSNHTMAQSSSTRAANGIIFPKERWRSSGWLLDFGTPETFTEPDWTYLSPSGPSKTFPSPQDIIGRYAYMLYDAGGAYDLNLAGFSPVQADLADKGDIAFIDLPGFFQKLSSTANGNSWLNWRHGAVTPTTQEYYGTGAASNQAGNLEKTTVSVPAGHNRLLSRSELVRAAELGKLGLSPELLPFVRTTSGIGNRIDLQDLFADGSSTPILYTDPSLSASADTSFSIYQLDGSQHSYQVRQGNPLFQQRFALSRLRWFAERNAAGTPLRQTEIKRHFGLTWDSTLKRFIYTTPDASAAVSSIKTLQQLAQDIKDGTVPPREPDFFEWLKAGIDPVSLGQTGGVTNRSFSTTSTNPAETPWEISKDLHVLRIGANAIDQADPDSIPTGIRSNFTGVEPSPFDSFGVENLPYLNEVITSVLRSNGGSGSDLNGYLQFELWNPHRNAFTGNPPLDYQGKPISAITVGTDAGRVVMEPEVAVEARRSYPGETANATWRNYVTVKSYSQTPLAASMFNSPALAGKRLTLSFTATSYSSSTPYFDEPLLANSTQAFGQDETNSATGPDGQSVVYGAPPSDGTNAILVTSVTPPYPAISGVPLANPTLGGPGMTSAGIYPHGTTDKFGNFATTNPSGSKDWNAVAFHSDGSTLYGTATEPIDLVLEVVDQDGNVFLAARYHRLALGRWLSDHRPGVIRTNDTRTFQEGIIWPQNSGAGPQPAPFTNWTGDFGLRKGYPMTDPRTERFGLSDHIGASPGMGILADDVAFSGGGPDWNLVHGLTASVGSDFSTPGVNISNSPAQANWNLAQTTGLSPVFISIPADLARNMNGAPSNGHSYQDADGTLRPADARWVPTDAHPALPVADYPEALRARPIILNRPFRSVGELGLVFRDIPWKSLDLFSPQSADRRLTGIFSLNDQENTEGKINPNSATTEALEAIVAGSSLDPSGQLSTTVPPSQAQLFATSLTGLTSPFNGMEDLLGSIVETSQGNPSGGLSPYKHELESLARALSSTTDTRHWQLFIDLVIQAGRLPSNASTADLDRFLVESQRRYWVYLAIDRLTGDIVEQRIEPIYE